MVHTAIGPGRMPFQVDDCHVHDRHKLVSVGPAHCSSCMYVMVRLIGQAVDRWWARRHVTQKGNEACRRRWWLQSHPGLGAGICAGEMPEPVGENSQVAGFLLASSTLSSPPTQTLPLGLMGVTDSRHSNCVSPRRYLIVRMVPK